MLTVPSHLKLKPGIRFMKHVSKTSTRMLHRERATGQEKLSPKLTTQLATDSIQGAHITGLIFTTRVSVKSAFRLCLPKIQSATTGKGAPVLSPFY